MGKNGVYVCVFVFCFGILSYFLSFGFIFSCFIGLRVREKKRGREVGIWVELGEEKTVLKLKYKAKIFTITGINLGSQS